MDDFNMLGPAEKHIAEEVTTKLKKIQTTAQAIVDAVDDIDLDSIENLMLDNKRKTEIITFMKALDSSVESMTIHQMVMIIGAAIFKERTPA